MKPPSGFSQPYKKIVPYLPTGIPLDVEPKKVGAVWSTTPFPSGKFMHGMNPRNRSFRSSGRVLHGENIS
jgi:hypothetical protein